MIPNDITTIINFVTSLLVANFALNDVPHSLGIIDRDRYTEKPYYIQAKPPKENYLYHHSYYSALKEIANTHIIKAAKGKRVISLTTDVGRYLSPLPIVFAVTIDGVVRIPITEEIRQQAIPALYYTRNVKLIEEAKMRGYNVFNDIPIPLEYKYVAKYVKHPDMFVDENEYAILTDALYLPTGTEVFIHPKKLTRFKTGLRDFALPVRSLEELR